MDFPPFSLISKFVSSSIMLIVCVEENSHSCFFFKGDVMYIMVTILDNTVPISESC